MTAIKSIKRIALTAATSLTIAAPLAAQASSSKLVVIGTKLMDELITAGISESLSIALGLDGDEVGLSDAAFSDIEDIVEDVVATYQFADYETGVQDAIDFAEAYVRQSGSENQLLASATKAWDCYMAATSALNDMESVGLQGISSYLEMAALQVVFLQEMAEVDELMGADGDAYRSTAVDSVVDYLAHLEAMEAEWAASQDDLYPIYTRTIRTWYDGWYDKKKYERCFTNPTGSRTCADTTWTCKAPWYDSSAFAWTCTSGMNTSQDEIEALRDAQLAEDTDTIFGADYEALADSLVAGVGGQGWGDRDNPSGSADVELLSAFRSAGMVSCANPVGIWCRRISDGVDAADTGEVVRCEADYGFNCTNASQPDGACDDYEVQFFCPLR